MSKSYASSLRPVVLPAKVSHCSPCLVPRPGSMIRFYSVPNASMSKVYKLAVPPESHVPMLPGNALPQPATVCLPVPGNYFTPMLIATSDPLAVCAGFSNSFCCRMCHSVLIPSFFAEAPLQLLVPSARAMAPYQLPSAVPKGTSLSRQKRRRRRRRQAPLSPPRLQLVHES